MNSARGQGTLRLPSPLEEALVRKAEDDADRLGRYLELQLGKPASEASLPNVCLLELSAVVQIGVWERQGLRPLLEEDIPSYAEACASLAARCEHGLEAFLDPSDTPLRSLTLRIFVERLAWDGRMLLETDIVVGDVDENHFADVLAEFLWNHRGELSTLLSAEGASR